MSAAIYHCDEFHCNDRFMNEMKFDWDDLRLFLAVARHGGLAAASATTGKSPPTLGRRMLALERATGQELFKRLPRGYVLTEQGQAFLGRVMALEAQIDPMTKSETRAVVKISAGTWMTQVLCQHAQAIMGDDDIALRFIAADHDLDIARREAVIGIRNRRPDQIGLACRRVGQVEFAVYALDKSPRPWVRVMGKTPSALWVAGQTDVAELEVTTSRNALDLALAGVGQAVLPTFIADGMPLVRVSDLISELSHDQWLVSHHEDRFEPPVRRTLDRLAGVLEELHRP